jgi:hypothetical protein
MTTINKSASVNMAGWRPVATPVAAKPTTTPSSPPTDPRTLRDPKMLASMPLMATSSDSLTRQFYGGANVPTFRILPVKRGGGS